MKAKSLGLGARVLLPLLATTHQPSVTQPPQALDPTPYRGTSLIRNSALLGPYSRTMHRVLWWVLEGGHFLMRELPLYILHDNC